MNVATLNHKLFAWDYDLLIDVLDESLDERCSHLFNSLLEPDIIVEKFTFACQDA